MSKVDITWRKEENKMDINLYVDSYLTPVKATELFQTMKKRRTDGI